jgi:large subunit ribosomal protein L25
MKLKAETREKLGKKAKNVRSEGLIPGVIYGPKFESTAVKFDRVSLRKVLKDSGYSKLVDMNVDGEKMKSILKEVQIDPVTRELIHVSFYAVDMESEIEAEIPIIVEGKAPAVKQGIGFLETPINTLSIRCLPADLPSELVINVENLKEIGDGITIEDLALGDKLEVADDYDEEFMIAFITPPQKQESLLTEVEEDEDTEEGEEGEGEEGEGVEGEEGEGAEGEEGEAAEGEGEEKPKE